MTQDEIDAEHDTRTRRLRFVGAIIAAAFLLIVAAWVFTYEAVR